MLQATVVWTPGSDNNDPILEYIVYYNTSFDEQDRFTEGRRVPASRTSAAVRLRPWTNFTFSVQARNSVGVSERSEFTPTLCTTPPYKPYINPTDVCSVSRGADQLVITWKVCDGYRDNSNNANTNTNTNINTSDNVYGAVVMVRPLREFTRFI